HRDVSCIKISNRRMGSSFERLHLCVVERDVQILEIHAAGDLANWRHDDIIHERGDNFSESRTDDHTDCEINHIAAHCELFELLQHAHNVPLVWVNCGDNLGKSRRKLPAQVFHSPGRKTAGAESQISCTPLKQPLNQSAPACECSSNCDANGRRAHKLLRETFSTFSPTQLRQLKVLDPSQLFPQAQLARTALLRKPCFRTASF